MMPWGYREAKRGMIGRVVDGKIVWQEWEEPVHVKAGETVYWQFDSGPAQTATGAGFYYIDGVKTPLPTEGNQMPEGHTPLTRKDVDDLNREGQRAIGFPDDADRPPPAARMWSAVEWEPGMPDDGPRLATTLHLSPKCMEAVGNAYTPEFLQLPNGQKYAKVPDTLTQADVDEVQGEPTPAAVPVPPDEWNIPASSDCWDFMDWEAVPDTIVLPNGWRFLKDDGTFRRSVNQEFMDNYRANVQAEGAADPGPDFIQSAADPGIQYPRVTMDPVTWTWPDATWMPGVGKRIMVGYDPAAGELKPDQPMRPLPDSTFTIGDITMNPAPLEDCAVWVVECGPQVGPAEGRYTLGYLESEKAAKKMVDLLNDALTTTGGRHLWHTYPVLPFVDMVLEGGLG